MIIGVQTSRTHPGRIRVDGAVLAFDRTQDEALTLIVSRLQGDFVSLALLGSNLSSIYYETN